MYRSFPAPSKGLMAYDTISPIALQEKERCIEMTEVYFLIRISI